MGLGAGGHGRGRGIRAHYHGGGRGRGCACCNRMGICGVLMLVFGMVLFINGLPLLIIGLAVESQTQGAANPNSGLTTAGLALTLSGAGLLVLLILRCWCQSCTSSPTPATGQPATNANNALLTLATIRSEKQFAKRFCTQCGLEAVSLDFIACQNCGAQLPPAQLITQQQPMQAQMMGQVQVTTQPMLLQPSFNPQFQQQQQPVVQQMGTSGFARRFCNWCGRESLSVDEVQCAGCQNVLPRATPLMQLSPTHNVIQGNIQYGNMQPSQPIQPMMNSNNMVPMGLSTVSSQPMNTQPFQPNNTMTTTVVYTGPQEGVPSAPPPAYDS